MSRDSGNSKSPDQNTSSAPLVEGVDYDVDEFGRYVFTAHFLRNRGYCCGSGCRNCPYGDESEV